MPDVRIGPAGWSYKDWEGVVYPPHGSRFDALGYLASFFDTIEINSPFYRIPPPSHAKSWLRRVGFNPNFRFTTKVFRGFTHEKASLDAAGVKAFREYLDPMHEAGRLGAVLFQFPWSFKDGDEARRKLRTLFDAFDPYPRALEARHASFQADDFFRFLEDHDVAWVNIDQPLFHESVKPAEIATGPFAYVRFHGRNYEKWFAHEESWERYNYLYSPEELDPWIGRIRTMSATRDTYVITNNHFRGQAIINAADLERGLGREAKLPPQLREVFGERGA